jgi:hypothetical protein
VVEESLHAVVIALVILHAPWATLRDVDSEADAADNGAWEGLPGEAWERLHDVA